MSDDKRFQGVSRNKVDGNGRLSIPAKFRRVLRNADAKLAPDGAARIYVAYGDPRVDYVECLSGDAFDEIDAMIRAEQRGTKLRQLLEALYYTYCEPLSVDDSGRLVLPQMAREKLGSPDEVEVRGRGDRFQITTPADEGAAAASDV